MSVRSVFGWGLAACFIVAVLLLVPSCFGESELMKAYKPYNARIEQLLDGEMDAGKRLEKSFLAQCQEDTSDFQRYADYVTRTAVPFYDAFVADVKAAAPTHAGLVATHGALVQYAQFRAEFAHVLATNLEAVRNADSTKTLRAKIDAAERTKLQYAETIQGPAASPDSRFTELNALAKDLEESCIDPMQNGQITIREVEEHVRKTILPKLRELRASKFEDDEQSRRLRDAVAAGEEFFVAFVADLKPTEARARLKSASEETRRAAADALKKFKEELAAVRRLL